MNHWSPSAISTFQSCHRKWAWSRIGGVKQSSTRSQELGNKVHSQLENYLKGNSLDFSQPSGEIAACGTHLLPEPSPDLEVEKSVRFTYNGVGFQGRMDLVTRDFGKITIWDHKTTSDFGYIKNQQVLATDNQAVVYAAWGFQSAEQVELRWNYFRTRKPHQARSVVLPMVQEQTHAAMEQLTCTARSMELTLDSGQQPLDLPYNPAECEKWGGCPYRHLCNLSPEERALGIMTQAAEEAAWLKKLNGSSDGINPPAVAPEPESESVQQAVVVSNTKLLDDRKTDPAPPPEVQPIEEPKKSVAKKTALPIATLYIDCFPADEKPVYFETILMQVKERITKTFDKADYRFIEYQGAGVLAQACAQIVDEQKITALVVNSRVPEAAICMPTLWARSSKKVRGL